MMTAMVFMAVVMGAGTSTLSPAVLGVVALVVSAAAFVTTRRHAPASSGR